MNLGRMLGIMLEELNAYMAETIQQFLFVYLSFAFCDEFFFLGTRRKSNV